jgi:hypothetical protein
LHPGKRRNSLFKEESLNDSEKKTLNDSSSKENFCFFNLSIGKSFVAGKENYRKAKLKKLLSLVLCNGWGERQNSVICGRTAPHPNSQEPSSIALSRMKM